MLVESERSNEVYSQILQILKLILNLTAGDDSTVHVLLQAGLQDYLLNILAWNDPAAEYFSAAIETVCVSVFFNLVNSQAFDATLLIDGGSQWVLDRFLARLADPDPAVRYECLLLLCALVGSQRDHRKVFLVQNYDVIKNLLQIINTEHTCRMVLLQFEIIEKAIIKNALLYDPEQDFVETRNVEMSFLNQFFLYDGVDIFESIKERFAKN